MLDNVIWHADVPHAVIAPNESPKVKMVHGPSHMWKEQHLPPELAMYWGIEDPRNGMLLRQVQESPFTAYSE